MIDAYQQKRAIFGGFGKVVELTTAAVTVSIASTKVTTAKFAVQRVRVTVITGSAGKTVALAATSASPVLTPALDTSTAGVQYDFDFGPTGVVFPTANDGITATISAAGAALRIQLTGYYR